MSKLFYIPFLVVTFLMGCDSDSTRSNPLTGEASGSVLNPDMKQIIFDRQSYPGETKEFTYPDFTLHYPSQWITDRSIRQLIVILVPAEFYDPIWGSLDATTKCTIASVFYSGRTLEEVAGIYRDNPPHDTAIEYVTVNGHKAARTLFRLNVGSKYTVRHQIVQGNDDYFYTMICAGVTDQVKNLVLDSFNLVSG